MWIEITGTVTDYKTASVILRERYVDWNSIGVRYLAESLLSYRASGMWIEITGTVTDYKTASVILRERYVDWNNDGYAGVIW